MHRKILMFLLVFIIGLTSVYATNEVDNNWNSPTRVYHLNDDTNDTGSDGLNYIKGTEDYSVTAKWGKSLYFTNDVGTMPALESFTGKTGTTSMWVNLPSALSASANWWGAGGTNDWRQYNSGNSNKIHCQFNALGILSGGGLPLNQWVHLACRRNATHLTIFVNGAPTNSRSETADIVNDADDICWGREGCSAGNYITAGYIDDVSVYDSDLSGSDIALLYAGETFNPVDDYPVGIHLLPPNNTDQNLSVFFSANATDDSAVLNATLIIWNSTGGLITDSNVTNTTDKANWTYELPYNDRFYWGVNFCDNAGQCNFTDGANWTFLIDLSINITDIYLTSPDPDQKLFPPLGIGNTSDTTPTFNLTTDTATSECYLGPDNSTWTIFSTTNSTGQIGTLPNPLSYSPPLRSVYFKCNNTKSGLDYIDVQINVSEALTIEHPVNDTSYTSSSLDLNWTSSPFLNLDWCAYSLDGEDNISLSSIDTFDSTALNMTFFDVPNDYYYDGIAVAEGQIVKYINLPLQAVVSDATFNLSGFLGISRVMNETNTYVVNGLFEDNPVLSSTPDNWTQVTSQIMQTKNNSGKYTQGNYSAWLKNNVAGGGTGYIGYQTLSDFFDITNIFHNKTFTFLADGVEGDTTWSSLRFHVKDDNGIQSTTLDKVFGGSPQYNHSITKTFLDNATFLNISFYLGSQNYNDYVDNIRVYENLKTYPSILTLEVGAIDASPEWTYATNLTTEVTVPNISASLNIALNNGACDCVGCSIIGGQNCSIPLTFNSSTGGVLEYSDISVAYLTSSINLINLTEGDHNVTISCNDTNADWYQSTYTYFSIDTTPPGITITSPVNDTDYLVDSVDLNWSVDETPDWCGYSLDDSANVTITTNITLTGLSEGQHNVTINCNDTLGNMGTSDRIDWTYYLLNVSLNAPVNGANISYASQKDAGTRLNFTIEFGSFGIDYCMLYLTNSTNGDFSLNQTNTSLVLNNTLFNFDKVILQKNAATNGSYTWNVNCNITEGLSVWGTNRTLNIYNSPPTPGAISTERNISDYCLPTQINVSFNDDDNETLTIYFEDNHTGTYANYTGVWLSDYNISTYNINYSSYGVNNLFNWSIWGCDGAVCVQTAYYNFSITQNVTTLTLYLNNLSADRKYELETGANLTGSINTCTGTQLWLDIDDVGYGVNYTNGNDSLVYYNYTRDTIIVDEFNDSSTSKDLNFLPDSLSNYTFVTLTNKVAVEDAALVMTGSAINGVYPKDIVVNVMNNSNIDALLVGELRGKSLWKNYFSNNYTAENLTWGLPGAIIRYINYTVNRKEGDSALHGWYNATMNLQGFATDPVGIYFPDNLTNTNSMRNNTCQVPWIWDDFSLGEISDRWESDSGDSGTGSASWANEKTVVLNEYIYTSGSVSVRGDVSGSSQNSQSAWGRLWDEEVDIDEYYQTNVKINFAVGAGGGGCTLSGGGGSASCSSGIKDILLNQYLGGGPSASASGRGSWCSSDYESASLQALVNIRRNGDYFDIYKDSVYFSRVGPINDSRQYSYYAVCSVSAHACCSSTAQGSASASGKIERINISGMRSASTTINGYSDCSSTWETILDTTVNFTKAKVDIDFVKPGNTDYSLELSPDNGTTWESVLDDTWHYFIAHGSELKLRINLTTLDSDLSTTIKGVVVEVVPGYASGIAIDIGYDGSIEWNYSGTINSSNPMNITFEQSGIGEYIGDNCENDLSCLIPIAFKADTVGALEVSNMNYTQNMSYIILNETDIENNLSSYGTPQDVIIYFTSTQNGTINLSDLNFELKGDKNITITSRFYGTANYTASNDTQILSWRYSPTNTTWPWAITEYNVYPSTVNSKEVEPWGQVILAYENTSTAMWNVSTTAQTDLVRIYRWYDEDVDSCLTSYNCLYYNLTNCTTVSNQTDTLVISNLHNTSTGDYQKLYDFWNLTSCNASNLYLPGTFTFKAICQDCVKTW